MRSIWISCLIVSLACWPILHAQVPDSGADTARTAQKSRIRLSPTVQKIANAKTPQGELARTWIRYAQGLIGESGVALEDVVSSTVHCIDLEAAGYPRGIEGLKQFRREINVAFPDEFSRVTEMRFSGPGMIETELVVTGTQTGGLMGHAATGRSMRVAIHTLGRFKEGHLVERWDRMDFADMLRQLGIQGT